MQIIIIINSVAGPTMKRALSTIGWIDNAIYYSKHISSFSTVALFCCCYFICFFFFASAHRIIGWKSKQKSNDLELAAATTTATKMFTLSIHSRWFSRENICSTFFFSSDWFCFFFCLFEYIFGSVRLSMRIFGWTDDCFRNKTKVYCIYRYYSLI